MNNKLLLVLTGILAAAIFLSADSGWAKYKSRIWNPRPRDGYSASLTSEGVTIAVEPLFSDALAAQVFDKNDMITRGIMPLAIIIFNDNDFPVEVDGLSIEVLNGNNRIKSISPNDAAYLALKKDKSFFPQPVLRFPKGEQNINALADFEGKFLGHKIVGPHAKGGGFLYINTRNSVDIISLLAKSVVYIPNIYRLDNRSRMMYFEIDIRMDITNSK